MKKILFLTTLLVSCLLSSCNFLNVDDYFEDTFQQDEIFKSKYNIERYFNGAVKMLPREGRMYKWSSIPGATGSDEAVSPGSYNNGFLMVDFPGTQLNTGKISYTSMSGWEWDLNVWGECYKIIRKANTILPQVDNVPDMDPFEKMDLKARTRFLRAYAYYWILQNQGPVILLGDRVYETNETPAYYATVRNTYDETVEYICSELETAAASLPTQQPIDLFGSPTKGIALSLVARLRLQAASPLFNGGEAARKYFGNFKRSSDGVHYISQSYDERKWAVAALAAKRVIDLDTYKLHTVPSDNFTQTLPDNVSSAAFPAGAGDIDPYRSYSEMFTGETTATLNKEIIWGTYAQITDQMDVCYPIGMGGTSAIAIPQRIIDSYYMADGRDINNASALYPYENRAYDRNCVTQEDKQLSKNYILKAGTYKAYANREPRFYASIAFSGRHWTMESTSDGSKKNKIIKYHNGSEYGKTGSSNNIYNLTGYTCSKFIHPRDARAGQGAREIGKCFPIIRYAEILLSYVEALNKLTKPHVIDEVSVSRDVAILADAFNQVRFRGGVPAATEVELANADLFNKLIQRERLVEFLHENRRYYDLCRWGIFEELEREPLTGMNINANEWDGFYSPTIITHQTIRERTFNPKFMFMPLSRTELRKVPTLDQNPGWEN